jgi:photosystem II stability/assembly factor-like uncharacterized protein
MSDRILVATRKGLFSGRRRGAGDWSLEPIGFLGDPVTNVLRDARDGRIYATLNLGHFGVKLHRSDDDGATWAECAGPTYPKSGEEDGPSLDLLWTLETGGPQEKGTLWAGTIPGGLFRSTDGGDSWQLVESLWNLPNRERWFGGGYDGAGIHSVCVDPRDHRRVLIGISCGGAWVTEDGGASWQLNSQGMFAAYMPPERRDDPDIQDPHRIVQCPADPEKYWTQHHNGIFRSIDGGKSWLHVRDVPGSDFGFAVAVHPNDANTAWFVPAVSDQCRVPVDGRLVVNRTRDGGKTFETLGNGLPGEHAYDIVYRHGLEVDSTGNRLVMASTTGSLWISEDQGESWTLVNGNLPPVYAVRFA